MIIKCEHCNSENYAEELFCRSCKHLLYSPERTLYKLRKAQNKLEETHRFDLQRLRMQIERVESYLIDQKTIKPTVETPKEVMPKVSVPKVKEVVQKPEPVTMKEIKPVHTVKKARTQLSAATEHKSVEYVPLVETKEPSEFTKKIHQFFEPMADGLDLVKQIFIRYKKEGKLPIVLMTIAGILAILVGFGYLMQLSFKSLGAYSGVVKVGLGFLSSFGIGIVGLRLYKKDVKYEEYSSALLSLMIILNYLLIYFLTNLSHFPMLSSAKIGFLLIVANTGLSIYLAFKYETKIIAVLSLIGGALTPFYLNESGNPDFYFGYLWILLVAANFIAIHIKWYKLNYISFILFLIIVEGAVFTDASQSVLFIGYVHLFAYLFFYIVLFDRWKLKTELTKNDLLILCGNLTVLLLNLYNTISDFYWLGILYLANGVIFTLLLIRGWKSVPRPIKIGLFVTIGTFVGLAIPFLFGQALMGLFWSVEAILLIILGFVYQIKSIRKEGYFVLGVALVKLGISAMYIIEHWGSGLMHEGFLNYIVLGAVFSALWYLGYRFQEQFTTFESKLYSVFKEIIPVWLSSILFIVCYDLIGNYSFNVMIIPMFGLIIWHYTFKTKYVESIGLLHLFFLAGAYAISADMVNSASFSNQEMYGKAGILELLFSFWFLEFFYDKMKYTELAKHKIVQGLRVLFYVLLPLIFIKQIFKHATPYFPMALWGGFMMSYGLFKKFKHQALFIESHFLLLASVVINIGLYDIGSMALGLLVLTVFLILENGIDNTKLNESGYFKTLVILPYIIFGLTGYMIVCENIDLRYSTLLVGFLLTGYAYFRKQYKLIDVSYKIALRLSLLLALVSGVLILSGKDNILDLMLFIIQITGLGYLFYINKSEYLAKDKSKSWGLNIVLHQVCIILAYTISIDIMDLDLDGPMMTIYLVIHAIVILFLALKTQNKAMNKGSLLLFIIALIKVIFHDIRDFSGTGKIVVLIVLGVLLLIASYGYVRVKNKYLPEEVVANEDEVGE